MSSLSENRTPAVRRPWHMWATALAVFALYVGGTRDYLLILAGDSSYIRDQFGPGGLEYFGDYPIALRCIWTLNILGGLTAPVLLLSRPRRAHAAAAVASAAAGAQIVLLAVTFAALDRWRALGAAIAWFDIGAAVVTGAFAAYCLVRRRTSAHDGA